MGNDGEWSSSFFPLLLRLLLSVQCVKGLWWGTTCRGAITWCVKLFHLLLFSVGLQPQWLLPLVLDVRLDIKCHLHMFSKWLKLLKQGFSFFYTIIYVESFDNTTSWSVMIRPSACSAQLLAELMDCQFSHLWFDNGFPILQAEKSAIYTVVMNVNPLLFLEKNPKSSGLLSVCSNDI